MALVVQASLGAVFVNLGFGKHIYDVPVENLAKMPLVAYLMNSFALLSNVLSKTSFAITLLRIPMRWMRLSVWCIIILMNLAILTSVLFVWLSCVGSQSPAKGDRCVPGMSVIKYHMFSSSKSLYCREG